MSNRFGVAFGAILALVLLALFSGSTFNLIFKILAVNKEGLDATALEAAFRKALDAIGPGYVYVLTTVGGLVSALVIAQLSVTKPGAAPGIGGFQPESTAGIWTTNSVVGIYLFVWIFTGVAALVVGVMLYPSASKTISDLGTTWLGLAVSAAYAYFGINPGDKPADQPKPAGATVPVDQQLQQMIDDKKITFDPGKLELQDQLLRKNTSGPQITEKLQKLVLELSKMSSPIRIRDLLLPSGDAVHVAGRAVNIAADVAAGLLPQVATDAKVKELGIEEVIFDASVVNEGDRNKWNYGAGVKHEYDATVLDDHKTNIHFAVAA